MVFNYVNNRYIIFLFDQLNKPSKEKIKINIDIKEDITTNDYFNKYCLHFKTKINKLLFPDANDEKTFITDSKI